MDETGRTRCANFIMRSRVEVRGRFTISLLLLINYFRINDQYNSKYL